MVCNRPDPQPGTWDNPALFTAIYFEILKEDPDESSKKFVYFALQAWARWPDGTGGPPSQDEIIGWAMLRPDLIPGIIERISILDERFFDLVPFLRMRAGQPITQLQQILWAGSTVVNGFPPRSKTTWKPQKWVTLRSVKQRGYKICNFGLSIWQLEMGLQYRGGLAEMLGIYFPDHPMAKYAQKDFNR